jgi:nucleoside-diphosphate-sugar epimerase
MERFLVTGALGCLGAWTVRRLLERGAAVLAADVGEDTRRLRLVLGRDDLGGVSLARSDVTDLAALERLLDEHAVTHVVHLAALQVPFVRENPPLGTAVNVLGGVNVFEAVRRRRERIRGLAYASSIAVYGAGDAGAEDERPLPDTLYGVTKVANEGTARIYWQEHGLASVGLRPSTVYGPGRDQGVTSTPTQAMLAAARGEPFRIPWGGFSRYHHARDVADAFLAAALAGEEGARVHNLPGERLHMREVVAAIEAVLPEAAGLVTFDDVELPFPDDIRADSFSELADLEWTPFVEGVRQTVAHVRAFEAAA